MCGRFALFEPAPALVQRFALDQLDACYTPRYNVAPGTPVLVVRSGESGREGVLMHWGLIPHWAREAQRSRYHTINARLETVQQKPSYRNSWHRRRCLIPANGFYEWQQRATGGKQPWYIETPGAAVPQYLRRLAITDQIYCMLPASLRLVSPCSCEHGQSLPLHRLARWNSPPYSSN